MDRTNTSSAKRCADNKTERIKGQFRSLMRGLFVRLLSFLLRGTNRGLIAASLTLQAPDYVASFRALMDVQLTHRLVDAGTLLDVDVLDHIIVATATTTASRKPGACRTVPQFAALSAGHRDGRHGGAVPV